jgi:outer membrane immunogenic protein
MRRILLASTALTASTIFLAGVALGADLLPVKAPPVPPPLLWDSCYIGGNAGGVSGHVHQDIAIPGVALIDSSGTGSGFTGGGQIGCNWQPDPNWVLGVEGDINYLNAHRSGFFSTVFNGEDTLGTQTTRSLWLGTLRARLGYVLGGGFLYATGGLAISDAHSSVSATATDPRTGNIVATYVGALSDPRSGWTVGAGYEYAFTRWISAKVEYLHFELGRSNYPVGVPPFGVSATWTASTRFTGDIVRVGVNFQLHE